MSNIFNAVKDKLLTSDEVLENLSAFEPFGTTVLEKGEALEFVMDADWGLNFETLSPTDEVPVLVRVGGHELPITKEAFTAFSVEAGLPAATLKKAPHDAISAFLNRVYEEAPKAVKVIQVDDAISGVAPATIQPYSSVQLAESVLAQLKRTYGSDAEILADYKFQNTLNRTDVRFILPAETRRMRDTDMNDVPGNEGDDWCAGVHLSNSLTGKTQTFVDAYMFRWWCTNGATERNNAVGTWDRRRSDNDDSDVYAWAARAVDEAMEGLETRFDQVQALSLVGVRDASLVVGELFSQFNLPARQRQAIMTSLTEAGDLTVYKVMQAVTGAANEAGMAEKDIERLLRIGGLMFSDVSLDPKSARIWDAGHFAPSGASNPFNLRRN